VLTFPFRPCLNLCRRFGITNQDALANGETGTACRGEEHDITLVWSITSGKRLLLADGQEVHFSVSRSQVFEFSWTMKGNHVLKVIAYATPPMNAGPGFRQYDFYVDGKSFFAFPKVYRLGLRGGGGGAGGPPSAALASQRYTNGPPRTGSDQNIAAIEMPHNANEEEAYLQEAIKQSLQEGPVSGADAAPKEENLLLDFFDDPAPPAAGAEPTGQMVAVPPSPAAYSQFASPPPAAGGPPGSFTMAPQPSLGTINASFGSAPAQPAAPGSFASPPPAQPTGFASPPSAQPAPAPDAFGFASPQPAAPAPPAYAQQQSPLAPMSAPAAAAQPQQQQAPPGQLSMFAPAPATSASNADQAYQNFAKMGDFGLDSKNPFGAPAPAPQQNQTLGELKTAAPAPPKQSVMNAPPPGAMVVSQNQSSQWGSQMGGGMPGGPMGSMGGPPPAMGGSQYGAPPPMQQQPMMQQQQPMMQQQGYGAPPQMQQQGYGAPPPMQQQGYGAPPPMQQPQQGYGAPPPQF